MKGIVMKKHVRNLPTLKTVLQAACLSTAMAVPSYVLAVEVGVGVGAGAQSGSSTMDTRNSGGTGVVTDSRRTGVNATGTGSVTGTGAGTGTGSITGTGTATGTVNGNTGNMGTTTGTDTRGSATGSGMTGPGMTGPGMRGSGTSGTGMTGPDTGPNGMGSGSNMGTGAGGQMPGRANTPSGLDGNLDQNSRTLPDATRGMDRAEDRMNTQGDAYDQATTKSKASVKAKRDTRNRSNSTMQ